MSGCVITRYTVASPKLRHPLNLAFMADLHDGPFEDALPALEGVDAIVIAGDMVDRHHHRGLHHAMAFARTVPHIAPTFFSIGNHEMLAEEDWQALKPVMLENGVTLLEDSAVRFGGIAIGGLSSVSGTGLPASMKAVRALEAMAKSAAPSMLPGLFVCPMQDARAGQVYAALFSEGRALIPDQAVALQDMLEQVHALAKDAPVLFTGDGMLAHREKIRTRYAGQALFAGSDTAYLRPAAVAALAAERTEQAIPDAELSPFYLRPAQAVRQRNLVMHNEG